MNYSAELDGLEPNSNAKTAQKAGPTLRPKRNVKEPAHKLSAAKLREMGVEFGLEEEAAGKLATFCETIEDAIDFIEAELPKKHPAKKKHSKKPVKKPSPFLPNLQLISSDYALSLFPQFRAPKTALRLNFEEDNKAPGETGTAPQSSEYARVLGPSRLTMCDSFGSFYFNAPSAPLPKTLERIHKEIVSLQKSLPCDGSSSIFIAVNSANLNQFKALVSGSQGTPYEHGLYLFDILLPSNYPLAPPLVHFRTTGGGQVRFNPNLYNDGKVCLSIINTWQGGEDEMWNPQYSTILQVLLSIQSLVMDSHVIQKEPGFEGYPEDSPENTAYRLVVQYANMMHAMLDPLNNPPIEFAHIIRAHFRLKAPQIAATLNEWTAAAAALPPLTHCDCQNPSLLHLFISSPLAQLFVDIQEKVLNSLPPN